MNKRQRKKAARKLEVAYLKPAVDALKESARTSVAEFMRQCPGIVTQPLAPWQLALVERIQGMKPKNDDTMGLRKHFERAVAAARRKRGKLPL